MVCMVLLSVIHNLHKVLVIMQVLSKETFLPQTCGTIITRCKDAWMILATGNTAVLTTLRDRLHYISTIRKQVLERRKLGTFTLSSYTFQILSLF